MRVGRIVFAFSLVTGLLLSYQACGPTGSSARPNSNGQNAPSMQLENGGTTTDNPKPTVDVSFLPHSVSIIQQAQICIEDIKFIKVAPNSFLNFLSGPSDPALLWEAYKLSNQLRGRDIIIAQGGTFIDSFAIPPGDFNVVELLLSNNCSSGSSLSLRTASADLKSSQVLLMRFEGNGAAISDSPALHLNIQPILEALVKARSSNEFEGILDRVRGTFQ